VEGIQMAQEQGPMTISCEHEMNLQDPLKTEFTDELSNCQVLKKCLYHTAMQYCSNVDTINKKNTPQTASLIHEIPMKAKVLQSHQTGSISNASNFIQEAHHLNLSQDPTCIY
jgi:hypothetical protein